MMNNRYILLAAAMLVSMAASAQNLDPKVEVTAAYQGASEVNKPLSVMALPDSLFRFDQNFDYSVFNNPYKGTGTANPFHMNLKPQQMASDAGKLYLRAGVGYSFHPDLDFIWHPEMKGNTKADITVSHHSFIGKFKKYTLSEDADNVKVKAENGGLKGHDMVTEAMASFRTDWTKNILMYGAGYTGYHTSLGDFSQSINMFKAYARLRVQEGRSPKLSYDLGMRLSAHSDASSIALDGKLEQIVGLHSSAGIKLDLEHFSSNGNPLCLESAMTISASPYYAYAKGRMRANLGVKVQGISESDDLWELMVLEKKKGQIIYPDVHFDYILAENGLDFYAVLTGGETYWSYDRLVERDHFAFHSDLLLQPFTDRTITRADLSAGLRGNIRKVFSFDMKAGYALHANDIFSSVSVSPDLMLEDGYIGHGLCYGESNEMYAKASLRYDGGNLLLGGNICYRSVDIQDNVFAIAPSSFTAALSARYNFRNRIFAGVSAEVASSREDAHSFLKIPGFCNLGLDAEYIYSKKMSFWLKLDNLLDQAVNPIALAPSDGINFRVGISLKLR